MLAGRHRQRAAIIANRELPCIVKENLSDEDAWIYVIETNVLQRSFSEMLPSEKQRYWLCAIPRWSVRDAGTILLRN